MMKRFLLCLSACLFLSINALAQEWDKLPSITVTGVAEIKITPDEVVFSLDVTKMNKDLQLAKRANDDAVSKVLELTRRFGVAPQNVQTTYISVEMKYESIRDAKTKIFDQDGDEIGKRIFKGYEVSKTINVRLTDITRFEEFFAEVLKTGITSIDNVKFETSKLRESKDKAREMAMRAAHEKATAMSGAINQTIGKALKITEGLSANPVFTNYTANSRNTIGTVSETVSTSLATFAPGAITVTAEVTVIFQLK